MRYKIALIYLAKYWPKTASWVEANVGPRDNPNPNANSDLGVSAPGAGDHLSLVQCGLLIWIASGRPLRDPQNNWPGKNLDEIQKMFLNMRDEDLKQYLNDFEKSFQPVVQPPPIPSRQPIPTTGSPQLTQPPPIPSRRLPQPIQPPPIPSRQAAIPTTGSPQLTQPPLPTGQASLIPGPSSVLVRPRRQSGPTLLTGHTSQAELMRLIEEMADLKTIFVCDIPTGTFGVYLTEVSTGSLVDMAKINIARTTEPAGWLNLGRAVLTNRMGKCWSCAAAVIYKLVTDPRFDTVRIESIGAKGYDHHFVVINRNQGDVTNMSTWNNEVILIDAWQANLDKWTKVPPDQPKAAKLCYGKTSDFPYKSEIKCFCAFEPVDRRRHRDSAGEVGKFIQAAIIERSRRLLKECCENHLGRGLKSSSCQVSGFCDKK